MNNQTRIRTIVVLLLVNSMLSCTRLPLSAAKYATWVNDKNNGIIVSKVVNDYEFVLKYTPVDYKILMDNLAQYPDKAQMIDKKNKLNGYQYYTFEIASRDHKTDILRNNIRDMNEYYARIQYFSTIMQNDLKLEDGGEILPCVLFQFERDYGLSPYQRFILAFPLNNKTKKICDKTLIYHDRVLGFSQPVELTILSKELKRIPNLKLY